MSKCSVWRTRKSNWLYRTLFRPKYCASADWATARTASRDTNAVAHRNMGHPEQFWRGRPHSSTDFRGQNRVSGVPGVRPHIRIDSRLVHGAQNCISVTQTARGVDPERSGDANHPETEADSNVNVGFTRTRIPICGASDIGKERRAGIQQAVNPMPILKFRRPLDQTASQPIDAHPAVIQ